MQDPIVERVLDNATGMVHTMESDKQGDFNGDSIVNDHVLQSRQTQGFLPREKLNN